MDFLFEYIIEQALIVVPVLLVLGQIIKGTPKIKDWLIPYILLIAGILFTLGIIGLSVHALVQGVLVSGAAVFANQMYKQYVYKGGDK